MAEKKKFEIKRPTRTVSVCLDGDLTAEYEKVLAELQEARRAKIADARLNSPINRLEKRQGELYAEQEESTLVFTLRGLPRHVWDQLKTDNPPRKDNDLDEQYGFDSEKLFDAAMKAEGSVVEVTQGGKVVEFTPENWDEISGDLTDGQWGDFVEALSLLNSGKQFVPFSPAGYKKIQASAAKSK